MNTIRDGLRLTECLDSNLERTRYFQRQLLSVADMQADQDYFRQKQRRHNRYLHGWGSVCGLEVVPDPTDELPWRVRIESGCALGPYGDEIYLAEPFFLDLAQCGPGTVTDPCEPNLLRRPSSNANQHIFVAIKYAECLARPVRVMPAGCACEEEACEYSRIRDSFQVECLTELPPSHQPSPGPTLCAIVQGRELPVCPPCPAEPWVVLAQINLPTSSNEVTAQMIDNFAFRRQVFSTAVLQEQLIRCCCGPEVSADLAVKVLRINVVGENTSNPKIEYRIIITNDGPFAAKNVILNDSLNVLNATIADVTDFQADHGIMWPKTEQFSNVKDSAQFSANIENIVAGGEVILSYVASLKLSQGSDFNILHEVVVSSDTPDPDSTNNNDDDKFPESLPVPDPILVNQAR